MKIRFMMIRNSLKILFFLTTFCFLYNCSKTEYIPENLKINDFVWGGMNAYYKWQSNVPDLSDERFSTRPQLNSYLEGFNSPNDLFNSLLYQFGTVDRFSWIVDDYIALENSFQGIRTTSGIKGVVKNYENGSDSVFVYVRDIVKGSSAEQKGLSRGAIINKVNGQHLLQNNYKNLFSNNTFTVTIADNYNGGNPIAGNTTIEVTKTQIQENPIRVDKVIQQNGKKIGYLMYNQFSTSYDDELNAAFAKFKAQGITDLIVDLRYNGGGSVRTAIYLGSMITGQFKDKLYAQQIWNEKVMKNVDNNRFKSYFTDQINNGEVTETINSVGMKTVYFIVSENTASASELVINALKPYIDVKLVGTKTVGKQVGSITLYDSDNYKKNGPNFNTTHAWAMQPIVLEITNKNGENNPEGYVPEVPIQEDPTNLGVIGDVNEPLLARTLQYIFTGKKGKTAQRTVATKTLWDFSMENPDYQNMYVELK